MTFRSFDPWRPRLRVALLLPLLLLGGCASRTGPLPPMRASPDAIYDQIHRKGGQDAVALLQAGMRHREVYGVTDPYTPMRVPDEVAPIWRPARVNRATGARLDGYWEHDVVKPGYWVTR